MNYACTNSYGVATAFRSVVVADRLPPVLTLNGANPLYLNLGNALAEQDFSAGHYRVI